MNFNKARQLFFAHDGSRFYMSRNGVEDQYARMQVPTSIESGWLEELTALKLKQLSSAGNWRVLNFLIHHSDFRHLDKIESAVPLGQFWEKCAFLEDLLRYLRACGSTYESTRIISVCNTLVAEGSTLQKRVRAEHSVARVQQLIDESNRFLVELQTR